MKYFNKENRKIKNNWGEFKWTSPTKKKSKVLYNFIISGRATGAGFVLS